MQRQALVVHGTIGQNAVLGERTIRGCILDVRVHIAVALEVGAFADDVDAAELVCHTIPRCKAMIRVRVDQDRVLAHFTEDARLFKQLIGYAIRACSRPLFFQHRNEAAGLLPTLRLLRVSAGYGCVSSYFPYKAILAEQGLHSRLRHGSFVLLFT